MSSAQTAGDTATRPTNSNFPAVTFGVVSFLQYAAELHGQEGYNAFDVTRGYINIQARLSDRVKVRFTPDVRPTTDASLERNLALRLEYASLDVQVTDNTAVMFGLHEMPWLTYEADGQPLPRAWAVLLGTSVDRGFSGTTSWTHRPRREHQGLRRTLGISRRCV